MRPGSRNDLFSEKRLSNPPRSACSPPLARDPDLRLLGRIPLPITPSRDRGGSPLRPSVTAAAT